MGKVETTVYHMNIKKCYRPQVHGLANKRYNNNNNNNNNNNSSNNNNNNNNNSPFVYENMFQMFLKFYCYSSVPYWV